MHKVLVLGAGLVTGPLVRYLLDQQDFQVKVASRTLEKAEKLIGSAKNGSAEQLDVGDERALEELISEADLSISLLPYRFHPLVAGLCIKYGKQMVTASYVKEAMLELDEAAKDAGVIVLNEIGVDPGIDHMSAMEVIHRIENNGGKIIGFSSYCGGLPAPEDNDNPYGYKFSWSPKGVLLAGKNPARFLKDGQTVDIQGDELFEHHWPVEIEGFGTLEGYPNRNSLPYIETYGLGDAQDMFRGTLRYPGWCETLRAISAMGMLKEDKLQGLNGMTFSRLTGELIGSSGTDLASDLASFLNVDERSDVMSNLKWLGLTGNDPLPEAATTPIDILTARMLEKMQYAPDEQDMLVMQHEFTAQYTARMEKTTSTMIDYGIPSGDSSMSRLVGLPAAIAAKLILLGEIKLSGVQVPVVPEIYAPVLSELEEMGISFNENVKDIT